jgi:tripartite-type tricarboxylate transporter receptor subunit TctC
VTTSKRCSVAALAALVIGALAPGFAAAQAYPSRPIHFIVPYTPGTGIDILARAIGQKLSERLKVGVVVENKPGASGNIGTEFVAKAAPDGYTILVQASTHVTNAALQASVPYDPVKSFTPIGPLAIGNLALVVHPSVPAKTVTEFVALAKSQPGKLNYASPGSGTPHHLAMEFFKLHFGVDVVHVPYKGVKDIDVDIWYAMMGPAGMAKEQVALLNKEVSAILESPDVRESLVKQGLVPTPGSPEDVARMIETDLDRWSRVIRAAHIKPD